MQPARNIERIDYTHTFRVGGRAHDMPIVIIDNAPLLDREVEPSSAPILFFHGYASSEQVSTVVLDMMAKEGVHVIAPQIRFYKTPKEIANTTCEALEKVGRELIPELIVSQYQNDRVNVISNSMGSTIIGYCMKDASELFGNISSVNPMGLSNFEKPVADSTAKFFGKFIASMAQQNPFQANVFGITRGMTGIITNDILQKTLPTLLKIANEESFNKEFAQHALLYDVNIHSGNKDTLFLTQNIRSSFEEACLSLGIPNKTVLHEISAFAHENEGLRKCSTLLVSLAKQL